jgi:hypothetical protein
VHSQIAGMGLILQFRAIPTLWERIMSHVVGFAFALLAPTAAGAGERLFDGALGAASGAFLFGRSGFLAGGVIGYVAGSRISRSLGFHRHYHYAYHTRRWDRRPW